MEKALVLGGGGVTGIAWEIGILAGLAERGTDLTGADVVIGTSAGSVVGTDIRSGAALEELYQAQITPADGEVVAKFGLAMTARYGLVIARGGEPTTVRRRIGAMALRARTETEAERRVVFEDRVPVREWPPGLLKITAVDAASGDFVVFDAASGVAIVDAVGASCAVPAVWPPVTIGGRRYVDGGIRSSANADLAAGYHRVVVIAPLARGFGPIAGVAKQVQGLRAQGAQVALITPDRPALRAIGRNVLDPARRIISAQAGREQAAAVAAEVAAVWGQLRP